MVTGHCQNAVNRAGGHFLSALFSLLSSLSPLFPLLSYVFALRSAFFHPALGRGEGQAMATAYARWILSTQSRSTLKMQRFEPSIDLDFGGRTFSAPPRRPSLLSSLCSLLSLLCSLFSRCCSFLRSHFAPVPSIFASGHRRRPQLLRPFAAPSLARRNARSD